MKDLLISVGHICQNLYLACEAIGLGICATVAYQQSLLDQLVGVDGYREIPLYLAPVGRVLDEDALQTRRPPPGCEQAPAQQELPSYWIGTHGGQMAEANLPGSRIDIVGTTGSGKTTVARALAERLGVPHIEMDRLFWKPNWQETPDKEFLAAVDTATDAPTWVLDGNYSRTRPIVWPKLDTVVWLDYSFARTFSQLLGRTIRRAVTKEPMWGHCVESWRGSFFSRDSILVWFFKTHHRRRRNYARLMSDPQYTHVRFIRLRSPWQTAQWLRSIPPLPPS